MTDRWGGREICMPVETPQILPRADDGQFSLWDTPRVAVDCEVKKVGGLRKC